ncbi:hypothetical protein IAR50_006127 [Cryptococcus sp. DSM 104548]
MSLEPGKSRPRTPLPSSSEYDSRTTAHTFTSPSTMSSAPSTTNEYGKRTVATPQDSPSKRMRCDTPSHDDSIGNHLFGIVEHLRAYQNLPNRYMAALTNADSEWTKMAKLEEQVGLGETAMRGRAAVSKILDLY